MKTKFIIVLILFAVATVNTAAASGQKEVGDEGFPWRTIQVTGKLSFEDWPCPEITSKGKTYELMVPRYSSYDIKVEAGQTVTVEGYLIEKGWRNDEKQYIKVTKAVIDGKEYELAAPPCPYHDRRGGYKRPFGPKGRDRGYW